MSSSWSNLLRVWSPRSFSTSHKYVEVCVVDGKDSPAWVRKIVPEPDADSVIFILTVHTSKRTGVYVDVGVQPVALSSPPCVARFLVDAGSAVSIMGEQQFRSLFQDQVQLQSSQLALLDLSPRNSCGVFPRHTKWNITSWLRCRTSSWPSDCRHGTTLPQYGHRNCCRLDTVEVSQHATSTFTTIKQAGVSGTIKLPLGAPKFGMPTS